MSREIKFRLWDEFTNSYVETTLSEAFRYPPLVIEGRYKVDQYTGLKDKNDKEIYEGDIVNVIGTGIAQVIDSPTGEWMLYYKREPDEKNNGFVSVVPKNKPSGLWRTNTTSYIEVIGNIHENSELLGDEK